MSRPVMILNDVRYIERTAPVGMDDPVEGVCCHCALNHQTGCALAIDGAAEAAFGGDCISRDSIYEVDPTTLSREQTP